MSFLFHFLLTKQSVEFCKSNKIVKVVIASTFFIVHMVWEGFNSARLFFTRVWFGFRRDVVVVSFFLIIGILSLRDSLLRALLHLQYFPIEWRHWNKIYLNMLTTSMTLWNVFHSSRESPGQHLCTNLGEKRGWVVAGGRAHERHWVNIYFHSGPLLYGLGYWMETGPKQPKNGQNTKCKPFVTGICYEVQCRACLCWYLYQSWMWSFREDIRICGHPQKKHLNRNVKL